MHAGPISRQASGQAKHQHAVAGTEFNNAPRSGNLMPQRTQHDGTRAHHTVNAAQVRTGANGARIALGTDWPVVPLDPAASLHVAVTRQTPTGEPAGGWLPAERLKLAEAIAGWTFGSAYAEHAEDQKGTLAEGMLADIAVLDRDLVTAPTSELGELHVTATIVGGRVVYEG